ncbi:MAG: DUF5123 domain-containing protein [Paludibacteraceae bacterium]|nr:DUF5123 domain-containing protein [Paludibacteraceae bacterium]
MKKIFSFFAAVLVAFTANAATINIDATTSNSLRTAVLSAAAGDVIVLADGTYNEPEQVKLDKSLTIQAAEGAKPVLALHYYCSILSGAQVTFKGIVFDGGLYTASDGTVAGANDHCIRSYDSSTGKTLTVIDCEFLNWTKGYILYPQRKDRQLDALTIQNCYFHDNGKGVVYVENAGEDPLPLAELTVENSTFVGPGSSYKAIDVKNAGTAKADAKIRIDHCTFYNYGPVRSEQSTDVIINNSIFAFPTEGATATTLYAGAAVNNCLVFNMAHDDGPTVTGEIAADPKFEDAANGDFTLGEGSPALTMNDGQPIGDPRWWPAAALEAPDAAPAAPTWPANQVKAVYSATYEADCGFGEWGSGTAYSQDTYGKKYVTTNLGYFGLLFEGENALNCTKMEKLHLDIWIAEDASVNIFPIWGGAEKGIAAQLKGQQWNAVDIALSEYDNVTDWSNIYQIKLADIASQTFWVNNVYFYTTTAPAVDETAPSDVTAVAGDASYFSATIKAKATDASGAVIFTVKNGDDVVATKNAASAAEAIIAVKGLKPNTDYNFSVIAADESGNAAEPIAVATKTLAAPAAAPAPKTYKGLVKSIYSDVYATAPASIGTLNAGWWEPSEMFEGELAAGDKVLFYAAKETGMFGWEFAETDMTGYPFLHIDIYPLADGKIKIFPVVNGSTDDYVNIPDVKGGEWNHLVFDFSGKDLTKVFQIGWQDYYTLNGFFIDNVYFSQEKEEVAGVDRRINAYGLSVAADGDNYVFSYTANIDGTEANIVFYQNGVEKDAVAIAAPKKGLNQATIAKSDIPKGSNTWAVELKADQVFEFSKVFASDARTGRGQAVINAIPESDFFGYVYYTNRTASTSTSGLYVYNPDYSANGGLNTLGETALWGTQKFSIDATGTLWLPDYTDGGHSGVYVVDPADLTKCTQFFQGERNSSSGLWTNGGVEIGGSSPCAYAYGEGANTKLYVIQEDMTACKNGLTVYNIGQEDGSIAHTWSTAPSKIMPLQDKDGGVFSIGVTDEAIWLCQNRANGSNADGARSLMAYSHDGVRKYVSTDATLIPGSLGGGLVIDKEGLVYIPNAKGSILVLKPTYAADTTVTIEKVGELACGYNMVSSMSFDYAGNLIASVSNSGTYGNNASMLLAVFGMPTENNEVIVPAKKALVVEGTNEVTAIEDNIAPAKVEKVILNGQVLIIRDGKAYNMMGQIVR